MRLLSDLWFMISNRLGVFVAFLVVVGFVVVAMGYRHERVVLYERDGQMYELKKVEDCGLWLEHMAHKNVIRCATNVTIAADILSITFFDKQLKYEAKLYEPN